MPFRELVFSPECRRWPLTKKAIDSRSAPDTSSAFQMQQEKLRSLNRCHRKNDTSKWAGRLRTSSYPKQMFQTSKLKLRRVWMNPSLHPRRNRTTHHMTNSSSTIEGEAGTVRVLSDTFFFSQLSRRCGREVKRAKSRSRGSVECVAKRE